MNGRLWYTKIIYVPGLENLDNKIKTRRYMEIKHFLGKKVFMVVDRSLGSKHPKHKFIYEANYGYVPNTKAPDGEEIDAYYLGVNSPIKRVKGVCIAIIHRTNDEDDKLVIVPKSKIKMTDKEIEKATSFQEHWFEHKIIR